MLFLISTIPLLVIGVGAIAIYALSLKFGKSDASDTDQPSSLVTDAHQIQDDIDKAMWEAGKHDISKQVDVPIVPKQMVRDVRTPEQIQEEDQVDEGTALAMSFDEMDDLIKPFSDDSFDGLSEINPATGLPMMGGVGGIDVAGNPYGFDNDDLLSNDDWHRSSFDD